MTVLVSETKARCLENRRLVAGSRLLIARSRRLLNPAFEISGGSDDDLRRMIRTRLATGAPFPVDGKVPAGKGAGKLVQTRSHELAGRSHMIDNFWWDRIKPELFRYVDAVGMELVHDAIRL